MTQFGHVQNPSTLTVWVTKMGVGFKCINYWKGLFRNSNNWKNVLNWSRSLADFTMKICNCESSNHTLKNFNPPFSLLHRKFFKNKSNLIEALLSMLFVRSKICH